MENCMEQMPMKIALAPATAEMLDNAEVAADFL